MMLQAAIDVGQGHRPHAFIDSFEDFTEILELVALRHLKNEEEAAQLAQVRGSAGGPAAAEAYS